MTNRDSGDVGGPRVNDVVTESDNMNAANGVQILQRTGLYCSLDDASNWLSHAEYIKGGIAALVQVSVTYPVHKVCGQHFCFLGHCVEFLAHIFTLSVDAVGYAHSNLSPWCLRTSLLCHLYSMNHDDINIVFSKVQRFKGSMLATHIAHITHTPSAQNMTDHVSTANPRHMRQEHPTHVARRKIRESLQRRATAHVSTRDEYVCHVW